MASGRFGFTIDNVRMQTSGLEPGQKMQRVVVQYTATKAQLIANQGTGILVGWVDIGTSDIPSAGRMGDITKTTSAGLHKLISASGLKPTQQAGLFFTAPTRLGKHTLALAVYEPAQGNQYEITRKEHVSFSVGKEVARNQNTKPNRQPRAEGSEPSGTTPRVLDLAFLTGGVDLGTLNMSKAERRLRGYDRKPIPSGLVGTWVSDESSLVFIYRGDGRFANVYLTGSDRVRGREFGMFVIHEITGSGGSMTLDITQRNQAGGGHTHQKHVLQGNVIRYAGKRWRRQE